MKKEELSSGAEKVERIAREKGGVFEDSAPGSEMQAAAGGSAQTKDESEALSERAESERERIQRMKEEREKQRAEKRLEIAKLKEEKKEKRAQSKLDAQEKRRYREEERRARREILKSETEEERQVRLAEERAARGRDGERQARDKSRAYLEKRRQKEEARRKKHELREEKKKNRRDRAPGFGGWLAAVISLGVAVLALGAIVTVGYFDLTEAKAGLYNGYQSALYEFAELVDNMDVNLAKARVASGTYEMQKVLTDVLVESELAESCLESFPVDAHRTENLTAFVNRVGDYSRSLVNKLALGGEISAEEEAVIEYMYETTEKIKAELSEVIAGGKEKNIGEVLREGGLADRMDTLENNTIETPKMIYDGPFAASEQGGAGKMLESMPEVSEKEVEKIAADVFSGYGVTRLSHAGKTERGGLSLYGIEFETETGDRYFAQFTERGGKLMLMDSFRPCKDKNFDSDACIGIAESFLKKLGYEGLEPVWVSESGVQCDINFAYTEGGAVCYNDLVKVKVCEERGAVTGVEARAYLTNHTARDIPSPAISKSKIERAAASRMDLAGVRLALIPVEGKETLCFEVNGTHGGREYYAYLDAKSGRMVELFTVVDSGSGRSVM